MAIFRGGGPYNSKRIKNFDLIFWYMYLLMALNLCAKFERNRRFEYYHLLPGFLVDTLLRTLLNSSLFSYSRAVLFKQFQTTGPLDKRLFLPNSKFFLGTSINFPLRRDYTILTCGDSLLNVCFALNISIANLRLDIYMSDILPMNTL